MIGQSKVTAFLLITIYSINKTNLESCYHLGTEQDLGFRAWSSCRHELGFRAKGLRSIGFRVEGLGVQGLGNSS